MYQDSNRLGYGAPEDRELSGNEPSCSGGFPFATIDSNAPRFASILICE